MTSYERAPTNATGININVRANTSQTRVGDFSVIVVTVLPHYKNPRKHAADACVQFGVVRSYKHFVQLDNQLRDLGASLPLLPRRSKDSLDRQATELDQWVQNIALSPRWSVSDEMGRFLGFTPEVMHRNRHFLDESGQDVGVAAASNPPPAKPSSTRTKKPPKKTAAKKGGDSLFDEDSDGSSADGDSDDDLGGQTKSASAPAPARAHDKGLFLEDDDDDDLADLISEADLKAVTAEGRLLLDNPGADEEELIAAVRTAGLSGDHRPAVSNEHFREVGQREAANTTGDDDLDDLLNIDDGDIDSLVEADNKAVRKVQAEQRARREKAAAAGKKAGASSLFGDDDADDSATGAAADELLEKMDLSAYLKAQKSRVDEDVELF